MSVLIMIQSFWIFICDRFSAIFVTPESLCSHRHSDWSLGSKWKQFRIVIVSCLLWNSAWPWEVQVRDFLLLLTMVGSENMTFKKIFCTHTSQHNVMRYDVCTCCKQTWQLVTDVVSTGLMIVDGDQGRQWLHSGGQTTQPINHNVRHGHTGSERLLCAMPSPSVLKRCHLT